MNLKGKMQINLHEKSTTVPPDVVEHQYVGQPMSGLCPSTFEPGYCQLYYILYIIIH